VVPEGHFRRYRYPGRTTPHSSPQRRYVLTLLHSLFKFIFIFTCISIIESAFQPVFNLQGSSTLVQKYGPLIASRGIFGCYLQTELGHGTNVGRLETTATYIPETKEFEIHSPTITSSKWWIGALGKTATHGVVQAKLIIGGKDFGPHLFFVQLRSLKDHTPLPGIVIGDIGASSLN
jgi:acyl-CoA oxidase